MQVSHRLKKPVTKHSILVTACRLGITSTVRDALDSGSDVNAKTKFGRSLLFIVASSAWARPETMQVLLEHGADVSLRDVYNESPLDRAVCDDKPEMVELLLKYGANQEKFLNCSTTLLKIASRNGCTNSIPVLIDYGAVLFPELSDYEDSVKRRTWYLVTKSNLRFAFGIQMQEGGLRFIASKAVALLFSEEELKQLEAEDAMPRECFDYVFSVPLQIETMVLGYLRNNGEIT